MSKHVISESGRNVDAKKSSLGRRIVKASCFSIVVLAFGPLLWLGCLIAFGIIGGDSMRVFKNHLIWEDEFVAKLPAALLLSSVGALLVFIEILRDRKTDASKISSELVD